MLKISNEMTILWGGFGIIQWSDILQIFTYGNMQNMAINLGLSVMHKVPPVSNSACVIPISLQQMHSTNLNMDMTTPFSQLLHKNSFLSNTTELHAWMRKINLSIIKLDCVKIVKLFTFEIRKKTRNILSISGYYLLWISSMSDRVTSDLKRSVPS